MINAKKSTLALATLLALSSSYSFAEEHEKTWIGVHGMSYNTHAKKPSNAGIYDDGTGYGFEVGFRFNKDWAARVEYTYLDLDYRGAGDDSGHMLGVDALYYLNNDLAYLFAGVKQQNLQQDLRLADLGIGKHWQLTDNLKLVTEAAAYYDFGQSYQDYSIKLGLAYSFGSSSQGSSMRDGDNDGVADGADLCPSTPVGTQVDSTGCNIDLDSDGVINSQDACPNTLIGTPVDSKGCRIENDMDRDGVVDSKDKCLNTPMNDKVDSDGCSVFMEKEVSITLRVLFANNSSVVEQPSDPEIVEFANFMQRYGKTDAVIEGHTSSVGSAAYNMELSKKRAESVKALLVSRYGIDASRLKTVGYGETKLLDTSDTKQAHSINRRIEVNVTETVKKAVSK